MMDPARLEGLLGPTGFVRSCWSVKTRNLMFARPSWKCGLFERIGVNSGHQPGQPLGTLAYVTVECALVPGWTALKGMCETQVVLDLASDKTSGWRQFNDSEDVRAWEQELVATCPSLATELTKRKGPALLGRTAGVREAARAYSLLLAEPLVELKRRATPRQREEARRIAESPGVAWVPGGIQFYEKAALILMLQILETEVIKPQLTVESAVTNIEHLFLLQILASRLAGEAGWAQAELAWRSDP